MITAITGLWLAACAGHPGDASSANLLPNGGFEVLEDGRPSGWSDVWTREVGSGRLAVETGAARSGRRCARIEHRGAGDWSFHPDMRVDVSPGDILVLEAWLKLEGTGSATLGAVARDSKESVTDWALGGRSIHGSSPWRKLRSRFVVPRRVTTIQPRVLGAGDVVSWVDDITLVREGTLDTLRRKDLPAAMGIENKRLMVTLDTAAGTLAVSDKETGRAARQSRAEGHGVVLDVQESQGLRWTWLDVASGLTVRATLELHGELPEFTLELTAEGDLPGPLRYPGPFLTESGSRLVVPLNEGIAYPVSDPSVSTMRLVAYGGHGISMAFWGVTDGDAGRMAIIETPNDAAVRILRVDGRLCVAPEWDPERGRFGYSRRLRYVFLDGGGHVAIAKRYRAHAKSAGLVVTLEEKRRRNPHVDLLVGAANVWCWERDALGVVLEMRSLGIDRMLWSRRQSPDVLRELNDLGGVLTSRYDIYQDLMDPAVVREKLRGVHPDWTQAGWPEDLMLDEAGRWRRGWRVRARDGSMQPCGVLCDARALEHARQRVPDELDTHPYRCRFIDTTTASPWRECYHPKHAMARSDSRRWKMELLRFMSEDMRLVTGSETGHEAAVPFVHYFEGMLSLGPYRVPNAGRNMIEPVHEVPERVAKFQLGETYRVPLWELVYHDCVVSQWYWGDYNNKLPSLWDKRDLFNVLYGTPPMFMFNARIWREHKDRFARSFKTVCTVARRVGYAEMTDHRFLTSDRRVQETVFSNGARVTVNFGDVPFRSPDGGEIAPGGFRVNEG